MREIPPRPSPQVDSISKTIFFWVHVWFHWHKNESPKTKTIVFNVFGKVSKTIYFEMFGPVIPDSGIQTSLFKDKIKILEDSKGLVLKFRNSQNLVQQWQCY